MTVLLWAAAVAATASEFGDVRNLDDSHTTSHFTARAYTLDAWEERRAQLRRQILVSAGLWPVPQKTPLSPRRFGRRVRDKYAIEKVVIETFPGFYLAGNLYVPVHFSGPAPGVLVTHGHWEHGRVHHAKDYSVPALCINLAAQGYVVFAYDMVGYNDTRQLKHDFGKTPEEQLWSFSPLGIQLWNSMRALDYLESLPEVDPQRLAITGASGGGTQTFLLASVDSRIKAAAPVNMVSAHFQGDDACEMAPGLRVGTNNVEIAALMAPRPLLLVSSTRDWTRNTPREEFPEIRAIYRLYGLEDRVAYKLIDAPHNYNRQSREQVYAFFQRVLMGRATGSQPKETETFQEKPEELLVGEQFSNGQALPEYDELFDAWRILARRQVGSLPADMARNLLRDTLRVEWPPYVNTIPLGERLLLERWGSGERVPARWLPGGSDAVAVVVHSRGSAVAVDWDQAQQLRDEGFGLLLIDVYQTGEALTARRPLRRDHLVFHLSDDAHRVQDILTGLAWMGASPNKPIRLLCDKPASLWCRAAAATAGQPVQVLGPVDWANAERDLPKLLFVPGFQRAGGLSLMQRLEAEQVSKLSLDRTEIH